MPIPATTGVLRTKIEDMKIGDYISISVDNIDWVLGAPIESTMIERPITGLSGPMGVKNYYCYGIKVAKGLIISDRITTNTISWDALNESRLIQGYPIKNHLEHEMKIRSLTAGVAFADVNVNKSLTDKGVGGWPINNEWDKYIVNFPANKIQQGKTLDDIFHTNPVRTWCQDTTVNGLTRADTRIGSNVDRVGRGYITPNGFLYEPTSQSHQIWGFRPVFEYKEV